MKYRDLLEHIVNAWSKDEMEKHKNEVWELLQTAYRDIGGFAAASDPNDLIASTTLWKMVRRDGKIIAVVVYRDQYGRKSLGMGHDGTRASIAEALAIIGEDISRLRSWAEVSGAPEKLMMRKGAIPIPNRYAAALTGKSILSYNDDGYHYTRLIGGKPYEKIIVGNPKDFSFNAEDDVTIVKKD